MAKYRNVIISAILLIAVLCSTFFLGKGVNRNKNAVPLDESSLPLGRYERTLELSVGQMISVTRTPEGESHDDNVIYDLFEEVMNIDIKSDFSALIGSAYTEKMNLAITNNELPDMFFCSQGQLADLIDQGMVADLTDAYEEYASPALRLAMEYSYTGDIEVWNNGNPTIPKTPEVLEAASYDGGLYGLPFLADLFDKCPLVWLRLDWLRKYAMAEKGYTEGQVKDMTTELLPKNFNEYKKIVEYFSTHDMDENGDATDSFGFSIGFNSENLQGIANVFGAYPGMYIKDDNGDYIYGSTQVEMIDVLNLMSTWYKGGVIDKGSAIDGALLKSALAAGKIGTFIGEYWSIMSYGLNDTYLNTINNDVPADWIPWAIRDEDGDVIKPYVHYNISNDSFYCMSADCPNPEAIIIIANHLADRYFSDEGLYTKRSNEILMQEKYADYVSELEMLSPFRMDAPNKNIRYAYDIQAVLRGDMDEDDLTLGEKSYLKFIKDFMEDPKGEGKRYYPYYKIFAEGGAYNELTHYAEYDYNSDKNNLKVNFVRPAYYQISTPEMLEFSGSVMNYEEQKLVNMYKNGLGSNNSEFYKFVDQINTLGMTEILEGLNG